MGLGAQAFTYALTGQGVAIASTIIGILLTDKFGRRPPVITGSGMSFFQLIPCFPHSWRRSADLYEPVFTVVCNFIVGGLGSRENLSTAEINLVVASLILLLSAVKVSFQCNSCTCPYCSILAVGSG